MQFNIQVQLIVVVVAPNIKAGQQTRAWVELVDLHLTVQI